MPEDTGYELFHYTGPKKQERGFWLYDNDRGMNLAMAAPSEADAYRQAFEYYKNRCISIEAEHTALSAKVSAFVASVQTGEDEC